MKNILRALSLASLTTVISLAQSPAPSTPETATPASSGSYSAVAPGGPVAGTEMTSDRRLLFPPAQQVTLSPGDQISVHLFGQADYSPVVRIGTDGNAELPLIGVVSLQGLTLTEAGHRIADRLSTAGMYREPQVTVSLSESPTAGATLVGELHTVVPIIGSRRLNDVLTAGGGLPVTASHIITINRPGNPKPIVVDLGSDQMRSEFGSIPIFPGDTIVVSPVGIVYFVGEFTRTGTLTLNSYRPLTLMQAAALMGGYKPEAKTGDTRIIRTVGDKRTVMQVNIHSVLYGKTPDPILQPDDIIFLPTSGPKAFFTNGTFGTALSIMSLILALSLR
jgi:polysaccharide export outer membrane protein